jgi:cytochrome b561
MVLLNSRTSRGSAVKFFHWSIALLILAAVVPGLPAENWLLNPVIDFPFKWLGFFTVPGLAVPDLLLKELASGLHFWLFILLLIMVSDHITMAFYHHIKLKTRY